MKEYDVAIVGATGLVGQTFLKVLEEYDFPINKLYLYASKNSEGKIIEYKKKQYFVIELKEDKIISVDYVFMSAGETISRKYAPLFEEKGAIVIDNSSAWRNNNECALIVPSVNMDSFKDKRKIIANPNCSTIQCVLPLALLNKRYGINNIRYTTYQAVSGSGMKGIEDLKRGKNGQSMNFYPYDISKTCIPKIGEILDNGYTKEEMKMVNETKKILGLPHLKVSATCVRVPVEIGHGVVISAKLKRKYSLNEVKDLLSREEGIKLVDDVPVSTDIIDNDDVIVGRIRRDLIDPTIITFYCVANNIRKGAASNAVQIGLKLINKNL